MIQQDGSKKAPLDWQKPRGAFEARYLHQLYPQIERDTPQKDILRGLSVSDSQVIADSAMCLSCKCDASVSGAVRKLPLCRECIAPGQLIHTTLTLDQSILRGRITKESLLRAIQTFAAYHQKRTLNILPCLTMRIISLQRQRSFLAAAPAFSAKRCRTPMRESSLLRSMFLRSCASLSVRIIMKRPCTGHLPAYYEIWTVSSGVIPVRSMQGGYSMIKQYRISLESKQAGLNASIAYPLYAWLLSQVPTEVGTALHEQATRPINQYILWNGAANRGEWVVNLMTDEMVEIFSPVLNALSVIALRSGTLLATAGSTVEVQNFQHLLKCGESLSNVQLFPIHFLTPTTFKQDKRYVIFPQESLILQSLISRWNVSFPEAAMDDEDAFQALLRGIHIVDYNLHTTRYPMKQVRLPAFQGRISIETRLPAPMMALWTTLYSFAPYAGIGVKTTLGMGGVSMMKASNLPV